MLTTSPITVGSPPARIEPTTASPVLTPTRICTETPNCGCEARERLLHAQRGPDGAFGVVLVGDGRAELGDELVADDLVEAAAERGDVGEQPLEGVVDQPFHLLGVAGGRHGGETDEVGHQDRDQPALVGRRERAAARIRGRTVRLRAPHATSRAVHDEATTSGASAPVPASSRSALAGCA